MPRCPGCFVMLTMSSYGGVNVKTCNSCFGTWISRVSLMHIVRGVEPPDPGPDTPSLKDLAALVIEGHNKRPFSCPECRQQMTMDRLHPMIPIDMQFCGKCSYVWLDVGKLAIASGIGSQDIDAAVFDRAGHELGVVAPVQIRPLDPASGQGDQVDLGGAQARFNGGRFRLAVLVIVVLDAHRPDGGGLGRIGGEGRVGGDDRQENKGVAIRGGGRRRGGSLGELGN